MRILWISCDCSIKDSEGSPGLTARHENVMIRYGSDRGKLAVTFTTDDLHKDFVEKDGVSYYPINSNMRVGASEEEWQKALEELMCVIDDFRPDIIQCFGAEWPYGRIAEKTDIPVIIHMMGFLNIYFMSLGMIPGYHKGSSILQEGKRVLKTLLGRRPYEAETMRMESERRVMSANRYFLGRTDWDEKIVRYYSPGARYFHVPEAVKQSVLDAAGSWEYHFDGKLRLFSHSSNDIRKGAGIVLRTAKILKELTDIEFIWKVAGQKDYFRTAEKELGINGSDVNIELTGMLDDSMLIREMTDVDLCIHPSIIDNSPHSICEAQLIGCPVIASNVGGVPQLVEEGKTGFLYPYNEPHTLAFRIADIFRDEKLLTEISANEVKTALKRHDPKFIADTLIGIYGEVIEDHDRS